MTDSTDNALKPCPFCGSHGIDRDTYWHRDYCTNCGGKGPAAGNSPKADWNTRADLAPTPLADPRVKALMEASRRLIVAADRAGLCDNFVAEFFPDTKTRNGQSMDEVTKNARRAMNETRAALAAFDTTTGGKDE